MHTPSDEDMRAYLEGEHGPPHPEALQIIQDDLSRAALCCCEPCGCDVVHPRWCAWNGPCCDRCTHAPDDLPECTCAMSESSMWACLVHGENAPWEDR